MTLTSFNEIKMFHDQKNVSFKLGTTCIKIAISSRVKQLKY